MMHDQLLCCGLPGVSPGLKVNYSDPMVAAFLDGLQDMTQLKTWDYKQFGPLPLQFVRGRPIMVLGSWPNLGGLDPPLLYGITSPRKRNFEVYLFPESGDPQDQLDQQVLLCGGKNTLYMNVSFIACTMNDCIPTTNLSVEPMPRVRIGDLLSTTPKEAVALPKPLPLGFSIVTTDEKGDEMKYNYVLPTAGKTVFPDVGFSNWTITGVDLYDSPYYTPAGLEFPGHDPAYRCPDTMEFRAKQMGLWKGAPFPLRLTANATVGFWDHIRMSIWDHIFR